MSRSRSLKQVAACFSALTSGNTHLGHVSSRSLQLGPVEWLKGRCFAVVSKEDTLKLVKELRAQTGAPIGDVRAALKEAEYNLEAAHDVLRKKGAAVAAKKASRDALQGLVSVLNEGSRVAMVEVNCETDFVARNKDFQALLPIVTRAALEHRIRTGQHQLDIEGLSNHVMGGKKVDEAVKEVAGVVRENVVLRAAQAFASPGHISTYVHSPMGPSCGAMCSAVALENDTLDLSHNPPDQVVEFGKHLAMQVVAMEPLCVDRYNCPQDLLDKERELLMEQAKAQKPKNADVLSKIVQGRLEKFFQANCLMDQSFLLDDTGKIRVGKLLADLSKEFGGTFRVTKFGLMKVGQAPRLSSVA